MKLRKYIWIFIWFHMFFPDAQSELNAQIHVQTGDIFGSEYFIENKGNIPRYEPVVDSILFLLQSGGDAVFLHRDGFSWWPVTYPFSVEQAQLERTDEGNGQYIPVLRQRWLHANLSAEVVVEDPAGHYFIFGKSPVKSQGYRKVKFLSLYPGIDLVLETTRGEGLKYSLILHPGADLTSLGFTYEGNNPDLRIGGYGDSLIIHTDQHIFVETGLNVYDEQGVRLDCKYRLRDNVVGFEMDTKGITGKILIDPWVKNITTLSRNYCCGNSRTENIGFDTDYDYDDHLYVYGGAGSGNQNQPFNTYKVAKYDSNGILKWTFSGTVDTINWSSSSRGNGYASNFLTEKPDGKTYVGNAYAYTSGGATVIRLDSNGIWDGFESDKDKRLIYIWDINFHPDGDSILCFGGDKTNTVEVGILAQSGSIGLRSFSKNLRTARDVVHSTADPDGSIYTIFIGEYDTAIDNKLVKPTAGFDSFLWKEYSGFEAFRFWRNKIIDSLYYLLFSNGYNALAANDHFLFYYDGVHIAAFDKSSGKVVGTPYTINGQSLLFQGGIAVDNCNYLFLGGDSSNIKLFQFKNSVFSFIKDIDLGNKQRRFIHDVRYNPASGKLFVCGDSIVASFVNPMDCRDSCVAVLFLPDPQCEKQVIAKLKKSDSVSNYSFEWRDSSGQKIIRERSGKFRFADTLSNLNEGSRYFLRVYRNKMSGGLFRDYDFIVRSNVEKRDTIFLCRGDSINIAGTQYFDTGWVSDTLESQYGCDSVNHYFIKLLEPSFYSQQVHICLTDSLRVGVSVYKTSGIYLDTLLNSAGCDSVVRTALEVEFDSIFQEIRICQGDSFKAGLSIYSTQGLHTDTLKGYHGCDSVVYTNLIVLPDTLIQIKKLLCFGDSFMVAGKIYYNDGIYTDTLTRMNGCDSVVISDLKFTQPADSSLYLKICNQNSVVVNGKVYNAQGTYTDTVSGYLGCDSVITIHISASKVSAELSIDSISKPEYTISAVHYAGLKLQWFVDQQLRDSSVPGFKYRLPEAGRHYRICLVAMDSSGCSDTACVSLSYIMPFFEIFNVFTPGDDGRNDSYKIGYGGGNFKYDLKIFNRWGVLVFEVNKADAADPSMHWNGKVMNTGSQCPAGSYFGLFHFYLNGTDKEPETVSVVITLIR